MVDVAEVVVRATPDGIDETTEDMNELEDSIDSSADALEEQTSGLGSIAKAFKGAMGAVVAGLAVSTGFLLSRIPVLGEVASGLVAVFDAIAFQLDKRLRPALEPVTNGLFELSNAIFEGNWGEAKSLLGDFVAGVRNLPWGKITQTVRNVFGKVRAFISDINLLGVARGAIKSLFGIDDDQSIIDFAGQKLKSLFVSAVKALPGGELALEAGNLFISILGSLTNFAKEATTKIKQFFDSLTWREIISKIISKLREKATQLTNGIIDLVRDVNWQRVSEALGRQFKEALDKGLQDKLLEPPEDPTNEANRRLKIGDSDNSRSGNVFIGSVSDGRTKVFLDGAEVDNQQGRFRKDSLTRRGG
jgi:hypothetical protein